ncbi:MAG: insulinase family protein [Rhizobiales bacterium]|nr:insulinase family protein [Hyphomicrobiales bacterium]
MPAVRTLLKGTLALAMTMLVSHSTLAAQSSQQRAQSARLDNGLEIVVIPDHRAPVVTHMVWYKVGAADEPRGKSGIAHFLEHLMFKGTDRIARGDFSKAVARLGGQDNAFTSQDVTAYFQRVAKTQLARMMEMEADRMANLRLLEEDVLTERDVILEERRSRVDNDPGSILNEELMATLYQAHPYGIPVIGWEHEIAQLTQQDAIDHYKRYYAPNNAILVVAGDVTLEEVVAMAKPTYGVIPANPATLREPRVAEPPHRAPRRLTLVDERAGQPMLQRLYLAPSYATAPKGDAEAIDVLMRVLGGSSTSRLYRKLITEQKIASSVGGWFTSTALDSGRIGLYGVPVDGVALETLEAAIDGVVADLIANGITEIELERTKKLFRAEYVYGNDSQSNLARRYGGGLAAGQTIEDIEAWPDRVAAVTVEDVQRVARTYFDIRKSATGYLTPKAIELGAPASPAATQPPASRS